MCLESYWRRHQGQIGDMEHLIDGNDTFMMIKKIIQRSREGKIHLF